MAKKKPGPMDLRARPEVDVASLNLSKDELRYIEQAVIRAKGLSDQLEDYGWPGLDGFPKPDVDRLLDQSLLGWRALERILTAIVEGQTAVDTSQLTPAKREARRRNRLNRVRGALKLLVEKPTVNHRPTIGDDWMLLSRIANQVWSSHIDLMETGGQSFRSILIDVVYPDGAPNWAGGKQLDKLLEPFKVAFFTNLDELMVEASYANDPVVRARQESLLKLVELLRQLGIPAHLPEK